MESAEKVMLLTTSRKIGSKVKSNRNRRLRRKRNKKFFLLKLKANRAAQTEESLCESIVDIFDINGERGEHNMQSAGSASFAASLQDVAEWQNQHQLAYWKSKALALQMENQMLHKHIKHLYNNQMEQYLTYKNNAWQDVGTDYSAHCKKNAHQPKPEKSQPNRNVTKMDDAEEEVDEHALPPGEHPGEQRRKKLLEMYGENAAKINGMETAMQLNFDHCVNKEKPPFWPNLPLKM